MSKKIEISLKNILNKIPFWLKADDIIYFCDNDELIYEFIEIANQGNQITDIYDFLIKNEKYMNKEKLVFIAYINYEERINELKKEMMKIDRNKSNEEQFEYLSMENQLKEFTKNIEETKKLLKNINVTISSVYYDTIDRKTKVKVVDSRERIDKKKVDKEKSRKKFDDIDNDFKKYSDVLDLGLECLLHSILLTDLEEIFSRGEIGDEQLGSNIRFMILENASVDKGICTREELIEKNIEDYCTTIDSVSMEGLLPTVKMNIRNFSQYINMQKLLLISAYRYKEWLDKGVFTTVERLKEVKKLLEVIKEELEKLDKKDTNFKIKCKLQDRYSEKIVDKDVEFSYKDLENLLKRFINNKYLTEDNEKEKKEKINNGELNLTQEDNEELNIVFTDKEIDTLATMSEENLLYAINRNNWEKNRIICGIKTIGLISKISVLELLSKGKLQEKDIVELYLDKYIEKETLDYLIKTRNEEEYREYDLIKEITSEELIDIFNNYMQDEENEENFLKFLRYSDLYKMNIRYNLTNQEESSNDIIEKVIEKNLEEDKYLKFLGEFYRQNLIEIKDILNWNDSDIIERMFKSGNIDISSIKALIKEGIVDKDILKDYYESIVYNPELTQEERLQTIIEENITKDIIKKLYDNLLIDQGDLVIIVENGIITEQEKLEIIRSLDPKKAFEKVGIEVNLKYAEKICDRRKIKSENWRDIHGEQKEKIIIDPDKRQELFTALGAKPIDKKQFGIDEESPFYDYEFYIILEENMLDSILIAERFYEDSDSKHCFAVGNATYFFKIRDYMVLNQYAKKDDLIGEKKNTIFRAYHRLPDGKNGGRWAMKVIQNIVKTSLSSDLSDYSNMDFIEKVMSTLRNKYTKEEYEEIKKIQKDIDWFEGNNLFRVIPPTNTLSKKNKREER